MRELVFKNLSVPRSRKREISIQETVHRKGFVSRTIKTSKYFIRNVHHIRSKKDFENWVSQKKANLRGDKKQFHIMKKHSDKDKKDKVLCKARGSFYAIVGNDIYNIVFIHSVKMEITEIE